MLLRCSWRLLRMATTRQYSSQKELIASIDVGTTSTRVFLFDSLGNNVASQAKELKQTHPQPGWMEEDLQDMVDSTRYCIQQALSKLSTTGRSVSDVKGVGITNQRETACVWSRSSGKPLHPAIVWLDARTAPTVKALGSKTEHGMDVLKKRTGLPLSTYFSAVKLRWLLDNVDAVREAHAKDDLMFGTVDTWMLWNLTGGMDGGLFLTDVTNASRTMLMDLETLDWDADALSFFGIKRSCLADIVSCSQVYGQMAHGPLEGVPIAGMIGDQQAALVGQKCLSLGESKNTYGTGCFLLYNTGTDIVPSNHGLLTTVAYKAGPDAKPHYALEGSIAGAGSSISWLKDGLELIGEAPEVGQLASQTKDTGGLYFVPAFSGLFAPYWDDTATGMMIGISSYTSKHHIARATLEATCYQTKAVLDAMAKDAGADLISLRVDGGMTSSDECMQIQADIIGMDVERPDMRESTALGSAICAGSALGLFGWDLDRPETLADVNKQLERVFKPTWADAKRRSKFEGWNRAIERCRGWNQPT